VSSASHIIGRDRRQTGEAVQKTRSRDGGDRGQKAELQRDTPIRALAYEHEFEQIVGEMDDRRRRNRDRQRKEEREGRHEYRPKAESGKQCHARHQNSNHTYKQIVHQALSCPGRALRRGRLQSWPTFVSRGVIVADRFCARTLTEVVTGTNGKRRY
jgi:hypothetical protein